MEEKTITIRCIDGHKEVSRTAIYQFSRIRQLAEDGTNVIYDPHGNAIMSRVMDFVRWLWKKCQKKICIILSKRTNWSNL